MYGYQNTTQPLVEYYYKGRSKNNTGLMIMTLDYQIISFWHYIARSVIIYYTVKQQSLSNNNVIHYDWQGWANGSQ